MKKIIALMFLLPFIFTSCSTSINSGQEMLQGPKMYNSINEFKGYMKELKKKSDEAIYKQSEGVSLKQYKSDFFFEPQKIPKDAIFKSINVRDVYIALLYHINNDISELIPDNQEENINMPLANEYATTVLYEWQCTVDEEGFKLFINDNSNMIKETSFGDMKVFYMETTINHLKNNNMDADNLNDTVIRRDYYYMFEGNSIHVALPYSIPLEDAIKYISVKKSHYNN